MKKRIAIIATHPIQYQAPWYRALAESSEIEAEVFFCHKATPQEQADAGFGVTFDWDTSLLEGYPHRFMSNVAKIPTIATFAGLDTPEIKEIIARMRYDAVVVHGWNYKAAWQAIRTCWQTKTPIMVRGDSHLLTYRHPLKKKLKRLVYRKFIPKFDACLAVGELSRDYYLYYGARADRVFIVPHVIDERSFKSDMAYLSERRKVLRGQWQLEDGAAVFLFAGKFIEQKRPLDFLRAIRIAVTSGVPIMGLMVGDGPLRGACEKYAVEKKIPVHFTGFLNQSEIASAYIASDVLVMTSEGETWGLVVNEAMICGRPCVVSDAVGCWPDMILPGETGAVFPKGDVGALGTLMVELSIDQPRLKVMGNKARDRSHMFSVESAVNGLVQAVTAVSGQAR